MNRDKGKLSQCYHQLCRYTHRRCDSPTDLNTMHTERRAAFKQTLSGEAGRRRREETNHQIRKNKKEENLRKRRLGMEKEVVAIANNGSSDISKKKHASVEDIPELTKNLTAPSSTEQEILEATRGFRRILSGFRPTCNSGRFSAGCEKHPACSALLPRRPMISDHSFPEETLCGEKFVKMQSL